MSTPPPVPPPTTRPLVSPTAAAPGTARTTGGSFGASRTAAATAAAQRPAAGPAVPGGGGSHATAPRPGSRLRASLGGLTTRGRAFLAAGIAAAGCAVVLGQRDLLRVAVLVIALPLVAVAVVTRTRYRVASERRVEPLRVPAGQSAKVRLRIENVSRLPTGLLLLEDDVPYVLGSRPRFVVDRVEPRGVREVAYPIRSDIRGAFTIGPLTVRLTDPFGLVELSRAFTQRARFVVTPNVQELPTMPLGGEWSGSGDSRSRSISAAGDDDIATREYRQGDDLRRVHWRTTARTGELMVRREEQPWQSRATVLLDTRKGAHVGDGPAASFEWAVSAAASTAVHLFRRGYAVRLITDTGAVVGGGSEGELNVGDVEGMVLDALAMVTPSLNTSLRAAAPALRRGGGDGLLVAVLGSLDVEECTALARLRHGTTTAIGIMLDVSSWGAGRSATTRSQRRPESVLLENSTLLLRRSGWRVLTGGSGTSLPELWPQVAYVGLDDDPAARIAARAAAVARERGDSPADSQHRPPSRTAGRAAATAAGDRP